MSWVRFKPGLTVRSRYAGEEVWYGGVIQSLTGGTFGYGNTTWELRYWTLEYNGSYIGTNYESRSTLTEKFEGERPIEESEIIADSAFDGPLDESVKEIVERGEKGFSLLTKKCQYYNGTFKVLERKISSAVYIVSRCVRQ